MDNNAANFWSRISLLRNARKMTIKELAQAVGIGESRLKSAATQKQKPSAMLAHQIAQALDTSVEYLVTGRECSHGLMLSPEALEIAQRYDQLSPQAQESIMSTIKLLTDGNR